jgi:hypothetical protein
MSKNSLFQTRNGESLPKIKTGRRPKIVVKLTSNQFLPEQRALQSRRAEAELSFLSLNA